VAIPSFEKSGLAPIVCRDARILILGSLPGDASLAARLYYAHPRNQFWDLISSVVGQDIVTMAYTERLTILHRTGIALWDVIGKATRTGSLDQHIREAQPNDIRRFVRQMPHLRAVAFNGNMAAAIAGNVLDDLAIDILHLPSSSPANTKLIREKSVEWSAISAYL